MQPLQGSGFYGLTEPRRLNGRLRAYACNERGSWVEIDLLFVWLR